MNGYRTYMKIGDTENSDIQSFTENGYRINYTFNVRNPREGERIIDPIKIESEQDIPWTVRKQIMDSDCLELGFMTLDENGKIVEKTLIKDGLCLKLAVDIKADCPFPKVFIKVYAGKLIVGNNIEVENLNREKFDRHLANMKRIRRERDALTDLLDDKNINYFNHVFP
ncbi:MAG: hypothetical protein LBE91_20725 [Tannerella sp.]|jgi:hypothetical protein|nr:hypothetical protein [Tannerella sp.]